MENAKVIDGFVCYAPELALGNDGFSVDVFKFLAGIEDHNFWFRSRNRFIKHLVSRYSGTKKPCEFLEIGCGTGYVIKGLSELTNLKIVGSEIYVEGLKYAKERLNGVELIQLDATKMPFVSQFDAIGAFDVIEHISDDETVIGNIYTSLKEGGYAYISVPQYKFMWSYLDDMAYHKRRYSRKELVRKVRDAGFQVEYITGFVFTLFPLMLISRFLKGKGKATGKHEFSELNTSRFMSAVLSVFMRIDEVLIRWGISLPWGGSLVIVAKK